MSTRRKAAAKVVLPVKKSAKNPTATFSINESRTTVATNAVTAQNPPSQLADKDVLEIHSSSEDEDREKYDESDKNTEIADSVQVKKVAGTEAVGSKTAHGIDDVEMKSIDQNRGETAFPTEDEDSDNAPTFGDLIRSNDPIEVPAGLVAPSMTAANGKMLAPPSLSSLGTVLSQALRTDDNDLLESCFRVTDIGTIRNTIQRLDSVLAGALLLKIASRLHRRPGRAGTLMTWVQWALVCHGGALAKEPDLVSKLTELQRVLKERADGLGSLLMLKGKLDMLESQMNMRRAVRKQNLNNEQSDNDEKGIIYVEGDANDSGDDLAEGVANHMPLVNGIASDDSEDEEEEIDDEEEESNAEEMDDDDEIDQDEELSEEEEDSDLGEAAAPPAKIRKTTGGSRQR